MDIKKQIESYYRKLGKEIPRLHTTTKEVFQRIKSSGYLIAPALGGASFSKINVGVVRAGTIAIRVRPSSVGKFVDWATTHPAGDIPRFWPAGMPNSGGFKTYIPTNHLEYFDASFGAWVEVDTDIPSLHVLDLSN
jgi:hypothetical protein